MWSFGIRREGSNVLDRVYPDYCDTIEHGNAGGNYIIQYLNVVCENNGVVESLIRMGCKASRSNCTKMVKRKAESNTYIGSISEESENVTPRVKAAVEPELDTTASEPTGEGQSLESAHHHVTPITATVTEEGSQEPHPFWDLLSLAGYQTR